MLFAEPLNGSTFQLSRSGELENPKSNACTLLAAKDDVVSGYRGAVSFNGTVCVEKILLVCREGSCSKYELLAYAAALAFMAGVAVGVCKWACWRVLVNGESCPFMFEGGMGMKGGGLPKAEMKPPSSGWFAEGGGESGGAWHATFRLNL